MTTPTDPSNMKWFDLAPPWAREMFTVISAKLFEISDKESSIMAQVKVEQADLDNLQTSLGQIAGDLETELQALNLPAGDLSGVQAVVDRLRNDVVVPAPAPPTP